MRAYLRKMKGGGKSPPGVGPKEVLWSWLGAAAGIGVCSYLSVEYFEPKASTLIIGSFGASAVLVYAAIKSPLAQPRNLVGGHIISALVGVASYQLLGAFWPAAALAVSCAVAAMLITKTVHPPGGATALIAVIGGKKIHDLGFLYAIVPAGAGAIILLIIALVMNNLSKDRKYPEYWF
jgi:CBS-domain-containing membrane protein